MNEIIYPLGTALWFKNHTKLTNKQIAQACNLQTFELLGIQTRNDIKERNPIELQQFSLSDIKQCENDSNKILKSTIAFSYNKKNYSLSANAQKQIKGDHNSVIKAVRYLMDCYPQISQEAISIILGISSKSVLAVFEDINSNNIYTTNSNHNNFGSNNISEMINKICSRDVLDKIVLHGDINHYHKTCKKLSPEIIHGIINWLKETYSISNIYDIYHMMFPLSPSKIDNILKLSYNITYNPIENNIMTNRYIDYYIQYINNI